MNKHVLLLVQKNVPINYILNVYLHLIGLWTSKHELILVPQTN